jgi:hypothetical protein
MYSKNKNAKKSSSSSKKHFMFTALGVLICGVILLGILEVAGVTHLFRNEKIPSATSGSSETKGEPNAQLSSDGENPTAPAADSQKSNDGATSTAFLLTPSGNFISNHRPNLSGSPAPNTITSVCNTTPGSKCQIIFTKDGVTKSLPVQVVDSGGSTYWSNWKLQNYGLTAGSWKVSAVATLGDQTKTATDALQLEVSQ